MQDDLQPQCEEGGKKDCIYMLRKGEGRIPSPAVDHKVT